MILPLATTPTGIPVGKPTESISNKSTPKLVTFKNRMNTSPWPDANCRVARYFITYDPNGIYTGLDADYVVVEKTPGLEYEKRLHCKYCDMNIMKCEEGYFPYSEQTLEKK